jgi:hypothetical protein
LDRLSALSLHCSWDDCSLVPCCYLDRVRILIGGVVTKLVVVSIISMMAAGVYACCLVGAVAVRLRRS